MPCDRSCSYVFWGDTRPMIMIPSILGSRMLVSAHSRYGRELHSRSGIVQHSRSCEAEVSGPQFDLCDNLCDCTNWLPARSYRKRVFVRSVRVVRGLSDSRNRDKRRDAREVVSGSSDLSGPTRAILAPYYFSYLANATRFLSCCHVHMLI